VCVSAVKVDVDVMRPFFTSLREGIDAAWARVPTPIQQRSKYIAVGLGVAWLVHSYEHGHIVMQVSGYACEFWFGLDMQVCWLHPYCKCIWLVGYYPERSGML
jgi:hypothetical protein